jgi:hypothetical protein
MPIAGNVAAGLRFTPRQHGLSTTYLCAQADLPPMPAPELSSPDLVMSLLPGVTAPTVPGLQGHPAGVLGEMQPPRPSIARTLGLTPGEPAASVTVTFSQSPAAAAIALTAAVVGPDIFKIVIEAGPQGLPGALPLTSQVEDHDW